MMIDHTEIKSLFKAVQTGNIFMDSKTFCDCSPKSDLAIIAKAYEDENRNLNFDLKSFVALHFHLPEKIASAVVAEQNGTVEAHIENLWPILLRKPDVVQAGTLLPLPNAYIVPGGRFGEIYYWDSYFTMLGLKEAGKTDLIVHMIDNFAHLINTIGYIPNGNRTYYIGRSQPPFFALMVQLLAEMNGPRIFEQYLLPMQKEYDFWMQHDQQIQLNKSEWLNRYWDENTTPRPEAYKEDMELAMHAHQTAETTYRHIRAAAASGWDFSTRWFKDNQSFSSIHTTDIIPVDLNALLYLFESILEQAHLMNQDTEKAKEFANAKAKRAQCIIKYCWNNQLNTFCDYDSNSHTIKNTISLAMMFPMFAKIATEQQAAEVVKNLEAHLLFEGGVVTTNNTSGQQWDSPNGWAPLQWITVQALLNYGYDALANTIMERWLTLNRSVFARTGKLMEKYNVINTNLEAGGGEYEGQDGFGWTNGVFLAMKAICTTSTI